MHTYTRAPDIGNKMLVNAGLLVSQQHPIESGVHAEASRSAIGAQAKVSAGVEHHTDLGHGVSLDGNAGVSASAKAGPLGVSAQVGAQANETLNLTHGASVGASGTAVGQVGAGVGYKNLHAEALGGADANVHADHKIEGSLGGGVDGMSHTHLETGVRAIGGAQAQLSKDGIKLGGSTIAGAYAEADQTLGIKAGGIDTQVTGGAISPGSVGVGENFGAGYHDHHVTLTAGGKFDALLGGVTGKVSIDIPTGNIEKVGLSVGEHTKDATLTAVHGATDAANTVAHGTTDAANQVADHTKDIVVNKIGGGVTNAANQVADHTKDIVVNKIGGGVTDATKKVGGAFEDAGHAVASFFHGW